MRGVIEVYSRIVGDALFFFMWLMFFVICVYLKTESLGLAVMSFIVLVGAVQLSGLFASIRFFPVVPSFDPLIAIFLVGALTALLLSAIFKK